MSSNPSKFEITASRQFISWLDEQKISLVFTTYQVGKIFFIGLNQGNLAAFERTLNRCMGLYATGTTLYVSTQHQIWQFENRLAPGEMSNGHDAVYLPQVSYVTGDLDIHDLVVDAQGRLLFVNTLFSCLATTDSTHSFIPLWKPAFISKIAPEDRCHLNGLAMKEGKPKYVTLVAPTDVVEGWRQRRVEGGCLLDVETNEIVLSGLSMPHSPRWYQDKLWLLNSGTGEFGYVDLNAGQFVPITFCPGYQRGLAFHHNFALIGISESRHHKTFMGLPFEEKLAAQGLKARCGIVVVDLTTGNVVHTLNIEGIVNELYDVVVLPHIRRPMAIGFQNDDIRRVLKIGNFP